ncbi:MAG: Nramp family divalent metal transporter [Balneolaceae bacterium]|nr:Nramp family divalent metal transporter [Balneolaceae bacterium]
MPAKNRLLNILFWSVLSAAFIGPGTITTAGSAGTGYGFTLLWALLFSTLACVVLQEASARLTIASGLNLGQVIKKRFASGITGRIITWLVPAAILLGCVAYEAGNILGGVAGGSLVFDIPAGYLSVGIGGAAGLLLWFGSTRMVSQVLGVVVAVMGICFLTTAAIMQPDPASLIASAFTPSIPSGTELLVIGLIGTTVVPYNLFLGSGLKHTQTMTEMRWSLSIAILFGGLISAGVLVVGSSITGSFSYRALAGELEQTLGPWAGVFFGSGLFAAGFSSALTAPLAASITARSIFSENDTTGWTEHEWKYRSVWMAVLGIGILFGVLQVQPVPAIILAQALNGIILPFIAVVLLVMMNNARLLDRTAINTPLQNGVMGLIVLATLVVGLSNLAKALSGVLPVSIADKEILLYASVIIALLLCWPVIRTIQRYREG